MKNIIIAVMISMAVLLSVYIYVSYNRYEIVTSESATAYKIDKKTGEVTFYHVGKEKSN